MEKNGPRFMHVKTCCVTGHRSIAPGKFGYIREELLKEALQAIDDGYTHFISGFAKGVDLAFASIIVDLMESNPSLTLEAAIPYRKRLIATDELLHRMLAKCEIIGIHSEAYTPSCYMKRNRFMVWQSQRVIAVYDGREKGGTLFTMQYARTLNRDLRIIRI